MCETAHWLLPTAATVSCPFADIHEVEAGYTRTPWNQARFKPAPLPQDMALRELVTAMAAGHLMTNSDLTDYRMPSSASAVGYSPQSCPSCTSTSIVSTAKSSDATGSWRCSRCGEVWESSSSHERASTAVASLMPNTGIAESSREQTVRELRELVAALDRRVPQVERVGEIPIARAAVALKSEALKRIEELETDTPPSSLT